MFFRFARSLFYLSSVPSSPARQILTESVRLFLCLSVRLLTMRSFFHSTSILRVSPSDKALSRPAMSSASDVVILGLGVVLAGLYLFKDQIFSSKASKVPVVPSKSAANGGGNPRDFVAKMKETVRPTAFISHSGRLTPLFSLHTEKACHHFLRLSNRHCRGVCN